MMLLSTVSVGASIKFAVVFDNKTFGTEKFDAAVLLTATHISKRVLAAMASFKYLVKYNSRLSLLMQGA